MHVTSITTNLRVEDIASARAFYTDFLGLRSEDLGLEWVTRCTTVDQRSSLQLVTRDATAPVDSVISVHTDDVEQAYAEAIAQGHEIVYPLTTEPWGVQRFFVRAPDGTVVNVVSHRD